MQKTSHKRSSPNDPLQTCSKDRFLILLHCFYRIKVLQWLIKQTLANYSLAYYSFDILDFLIFFSYNAKRFTTLGTSMTEIDETDITLCPNLLSLNLR